MAFQNKLQLMKIDVRREDTNSSGSKHWKTYSRPQHMQQPVFFRALLTGNSVSRSAMPPSPFGWSISWLFNATLPSSSSSETRLSSIRIDYLVLHLKPKASENVHWAYFSFNLRNAIAPVTIWKMETLERALGWGRMKESSKRVESLFCLKE